MPQPRFHSPASSDDYFHGLSVLPPLGLQVAPADGEVAHLHAKIMAFLDGLSLVCADTKDTALLKTEAALGETRIVYSDFEILLFY